MNQAVTNEPTALGGTQTGEKYLIQFKGMDRMYAVIADVYAAQVPLALAPFEPQLLRPLEAGESIFVWNPSGAGTVVYHAQP